MGRLFITFIFLFIFSTTAHSSTKIFFTYSGGAIDAAHLANVNNYWIIINKEKVGILSLSGDSIDTTLKVGDKVAIGVSIKGSMDALLGPEFIVGNTTQEINDPAEPVVTAVILSPSLQGPQSISIQNI